MTSVKSILFSPTGTSRKIANAVASAMAENVEVIDATRETPAITVDTTDIAIMAAPVYGGHLPAIVKERWNNINGNGTPAVIIAVYGNRNYENAVSDMIQFATGHGFIPVAAAAFVGEHSYSTVEFPIAPGRPDKDDIAVADEFGKRIAEKISGGNLTEVTADAFPALETAPESLEAFIKFVAEYQENQKKNPVKLIPVCDSSKCHSCGKCVDVCPTHAIARGHETETDASLCIKCCACVKNCTMHARTLQSPFAGVLSQYFSARREPVTKC